MNATEELQYFKDLGFTNPVYTAGSTQCWSNIELNVSVIIDYNTSEATFRVVDGLVVSTLGPFSIPNKHVHNFLRQIRKHAF